MGYGGRAVEFTAGQESKLERAGVTSLDQLLLLNHREVLGLVGIGPGTTAGIVSALEAAGLALSEDPYAAYVCARHSDAARDAELRGYFLCDACRADYCALAFSDKEPEWISGESVDGYCGHCNQRRRVRLTQWFLCGTCDRVVRSIGRGIASAKYVESRWASQVGSASRLILTETDPVELQPRGKRSDASRVATVDFVASRSRVPLLGIELKSGRSALPGGGIGNPMAQFQLDTTDCDDIAAAAERLGTPVFLVHAQVIGRADAPTERYEGVGLWWARPWDMLEHLDRVQRRPRETRDAAYFNTAMFRPFDQFARYLDTDLEADIRLIEKYGFPLLYRRQG